MSALTREKILKITAKMIAEKGLDSISIRDVCKKAGVKAPTVYYYFQDKDGLIDAVIALAYQNHNKIYSDFVNDRSPVRALYNMWDSFFAFVEKDPELYHAIVVAHLKQRIPKEGLVLFESISQIFKKLEDKNKLKLPCHKAAEVFYATAYGQALVYISQNKNSNLKQSIHFTRDMCIRGLLIE